LSHYTPKEEPNISTMQEQVAQLGGRCSPDFNGKAVVYDKNGDEVGCFTPDAWFHYAETQLEQERERWKVTERQLWDNERGIGR
jgi:hypothetical protein